MSTVPLPMKDERGSHSDNGRLDSPLEKRDLESHHANQEERMGGKKIMALVAMAFLWTGSQIPAYLYGGIPPLIYSDIGGADRWTWFILGYLFALGAICPFVGSLSDLFGRRYVALFGSLLLIIGNIVTSTAHSMNVFIAGMALNGAGAGLLELTALAVTSELAPTKKRGIYVGFLVLTILPFCPSVLWAQLIAGYGIGHWRYVGLLCGVWSFIGFVLVAIFYWPPPRSNITGLTRRETIKRIDFIGGFLSIAGLILFTAGIQWGGYQYPWGSAHVLAPLIIGAFLFVCFCLYEWKVAKYPMFPRAIMHEPRLLLLTLFITFVSGMNFFSIILFWPTQSYNVYGHDPKEVGLRNLALGFPILAGACIILFLLSLTKGRIRELMLVSCIFMTAGTGAMASLGAGSWHLSVLFLIIAGLGVGGIVVPASIITNIICPDEFIATVTALTLAVRVLGGAIGYAIYYNVFLNHFKKNVVMDVGYVAQKTGIMNNQIIGEIIQLTGAGLITDIRGVPGVTSDAQYEALVAAGQAAYAKSYPYVYYVSLAFGGASIIACLFLKNIDHYMTNKIAVKYNPSTSSSEHQVAQPQPAVGHQHAAPIHHDPGHVANAPALEKDAAVA